MTDSTAPRPSSGVHEPAPPPAWIVPIVLWAHRALLRAAYALMPAEALGSDLATGAARGYAVRSFVRWRIPERLAAGPRTAAELAAESGANADALHRFLRAAATLGLLAIDAGGRFSLRPAGAALARSRPSALWAFVEYFTSESNVRAWSDLDATIATGESAFGRVHGMSVWDWFDAHTGERDVFALSMAGMTGPEAAAVAAVWPFGRVARLCDVGGGRGGGLAEILVRHHALRAVLQDAPGVLDLAREYLASRGVLDRVELATRSFFEHVVPGCDAYLLKNVLHDWDDARAVQVLRNVRHAAAAGATLLVVESRQEPDAIGPASLTDVQMLIVSDGGRERGEADFRRLFAQAGFRFDRAWATGSLAVVWEGTAV